MQFFCFSAILDEVDILYKDDDFELALQTLVSSAPVTAQYLFVTATLPVEIYNKLVEVFPDCEVIMGPGMHRTSPRLEEVCKYKSHTYFLMLVMINGGPRENIQLMVIDAVSLILKGKFTIRASKQSSINCIIRE